MAPATKTLAAKPPQAVAAPARAALTDVARATAALRKGDHLTLTHVPDGFDAFVAADLTRALARQGEDKPVVLVHVAREAQRAAAFREAFAFAAPDVEVLDFPAWDCQAYDRVSPSATIAARRMTVLSRLARSKSSRERPRILSTTVAALVQRVPPKSAVAKDSFSAVPGNSVSTDELTAWLETNGFSRSGTVRDTGDYAVRGGIVDLYAPGMVAPVRLDFFGHTLESIRAFDPETQRTTGQLRALDLVPMSEVQLTTDTIRRFRQAYVAEFGAQTRGDQLYEAISEGRRHPGMEHWLPLFHGELDTLFDYLGEAPVLLDPMARDAATERFAIIKDHYENRKTATNFKGDGSLYKPLAPDKLYMTAEDFADTLELIPVAQVTPFDVAAKTAIDCGGKPGRDFAAERADESANVFNAAVAHIQTLQKDGRRVLVAGWTDGSRDRLKGVLNEHGLKWIELVSSLTQAFGTKQQHVAMGVMALEHGFEAGDLVVIGEQDLLGDRLLRNRKKARRAQDFLQEVGSLSAGDIVVHVDHGIGRFIGLQQIKVGEAPHDCLEIHYAENAKLYLPVENLELLSRYGSEDMEVVLDRLGGAGWQNRKARMKNRIREIAHGLIAIAAERATKAAEKYVPPLGSYDEFCARFPYDETEDQANSIEAVLKDLESGHPMDRLICGDVGFGKTEVALRAAFAAAINGAQVAVVVPTTLLARQHYRTFATRFAGLPINVAQISRMVTAADQRQARAGIADGTVDIVVGTHAVLGKGVTFKDLGLVIIDEEQHFGVAHKERLKELRAAVHVLTLSATPIPRTLQLAMTGVRDLSIIATPPVDRLAVRTSIFPFDEMLVREALLRERYRGGQSFFVCPRIEDLEEAASFLRQQVPECKFIMAHGQMAATELEERMSHFYEGQYDVLLATAIVESGLDIPRANTLVVWRADMFGLGALYQLRGRVGRSKTRAYALFTIPANKPPTPQAEKRLKVLQQLDTLGAGFELASHDLDQRGAGNLLGDEQSGHIKEVGFELYQQMLRDAIDALKAGGTEIAQEAWSPSITVGVPVTMPEDYVPDLTLRLSLYRRLSTLDTDEEIESFGAELIDRFGEMPDEVRLLLKLVRVKALCRRANVEKVDAGPKGVIIGFRDNSFANPAGLVKMVQGEGPRAKVRPDMRIAFLREFDKPAERLEGTREILEALVKIAEKKAA
ncbi:transcription-repair coupling factor [Lichenifustis flavocetrariae]|uniref:Transcription-repair-coupling factor n=1 Tax=Lichenifustis flavocetrariae TaxID=2949735 RepID=A0AA41Z037_9HYPH|nr:transcription-repair coupling factor [Lichenifustis flavocetrariae]MCW6510303.1 transcription-repair coupling factor [Lichenifustis flavocetrariae]